MNRHASPTTFLPVTPAMRQLIENVIEDLLLLLDEIDGDPDFEGDEAGEDAGIEASVRARASAQDDKTQAA